MQVFVVVDSLFIVAPIGIFFVWSSSCNVVFRVLSSFAIISLRKRELVALLKLCTCCHLAVYGSVSLLHGAIGWSVIMTFPGHTYFLCQNPPIGKGNIVKTRLTFKVIVGW